MVFFTYILYNKKCEVINTDDEKMTITVIEDGLISMLPPAGNEEPKAQRIWPKKVQEDEITSKGGAKGPMSGTGFFVDDKGHIITNYHVVAPCDNKQKTKLYHFLKPISLTYRIYFFVK